MDTLTMLREQHKLYQRQRPHLAPSPSGGREDEAALALVASPVVAVIREDGERVLVRPQ